MITKQQAIEANEFHPGMCTILVGPRGGEVRKMGVWRRNGKTQTWKTRPDLWRIPIKYGLYGYGNIYESDAVGWHIAEDCQPKRVRKTVPQNLGFHQ